MTSTVRSVRVVMEADVAGYIAAIRAAGHETDASFSGIEQRLAGVNREVKEVDTSTVGMSRTMAGARGTVRGLGSDVDQFGRSTKNARNELDSFSGRAGVMLKLLGGFGPALVPIASVGVPAIAGLSSGLLFTVGAGGAAALALHGVGTALQAVEKARLDPTTANLKAMHLALRQLGPDAKDLVHHLEDLRSTGVALQHTAAGNFLPGVDAALTSLEKRIPVIRKILANLSAGAGDAIAQAGNDLASSKWNAFFQYLKNEARPQLDLVASSVGHVAHGIAELFVATAPEQRSFLSFLRSASEDFDQWATRMQASHGLNDFFDYVRQNGPQVEATFAAVANAVLQIVEAAAPLGGPALKVLQVFAEVVGKIADSPLGTPLLAGAQALSIFSLVLPLVNKGLAVATRSDLAFNSELGKTRSMLSGAASGARGYIDALLTTTSAQDRARLSTAELQAAESKRAAVIKQGTSTLVKGAGLAAGLGFVASGLSDKLHLANTATLALAGSIAGPWGAAIGGGIGLVLDFAGGHHQAATDASTLTATLDQQTGAITQNTAAYVAQQFASTGVLADAQKLGISLSDVTQAALGNSDALDRVNAAAAAYQATIVGNADKGMEFADTFGPVRDAISGTSGQLADAGSKLALVAAATGSYTAAVETSTNANRDQARAINQANQAMRDQVDAALSAFDAETQYRKALKAAQAQAEHTDAGIKGSSKAALQNRDDLSALAAAWNNQSKVVQNNVGRYQQMRQQFIDTATAMGVPKAAAKDLADQLLHIPRSVVTKVEQQGAEAAQAKVQALITKVSAVDAHRATAHIAVDPGNSFSIIGTIQASIDRLHGKTITIQTIHTDSSGVGYQHGLGHASGGYITGPGTKTSDSIPARLSRGEYVMPASTVDHYGLGVMDALRARQFASGGPVDTHSGTNPGDRPAGDAHNKARDPNTLFVPFGIAVDATTKGLKGLKAELGQVQKAYDKEKQKLSDLTQARSSAISAVSGSLIHDPFGNGLAGFDAQVAADTGDISAMAQALATLVSHGLDPKSALYQALAASDDVTTAQQLAALSSTDLSTRANSFAQRQDQANALGTTVGNQAYAQAIREETQATRDLRTEVKYLTAVIKDLPKHVEKGAESGSQKGSHTGSQAGSEAGAAAGTARGMAGRSQDLRNQLRTGAGIR